MDPLLNDPSATAEQVIMKFDYGSLEQWLETAEDVLSVLKAFY